MIVGHLNHAGLWLVMAILSLPATGAGQGTIFEKELLPLTEKYCFDCHDALTEKAGLNLERFKKEADLMAERPTWKKVFDQLESGQMPPPKKKSQPKPLELENFLEHLSKLLARATRKN